MEWLMVIAQTCQISVGTAMYNEVVSTTLSRKCRAELIECVGDHYKYNAEIQDKLRECVLKQTKGELK